MEKLTELVHGLARRLRESAWAPLLGKGLALSLLLAALSLLGSGALDRVLPGPAHAQPAVQRRAAAPSASSAGPAPSAAPSASEAPRPARSASAPSVGSAITADGKVVLNLATAAEIDRLPGVGPKKAEAIVALRTKLGGRFKRLEDLVRVRGIKRRFLERLRPHVVLDPPSAPGPAPSVGAPPPGPRASAGSGRTAAAP